MTVVRRQGGGQLKVVRCQGGGLSPGGWGIQKTTDSYQLTPTSLTIPNPPPYPGNHEYKLRHLLTLTLLNVRG